jgi:hypothetical protein
MLEEDIKNGISIRQPLVSLGLSTRSCTELTQQLEVLVTSPRK